MAAAGIGGLAIALVASLFTSGAGAPAATASATHFSKVKPSTIRPSTTRATTLAATSAARTTLLRPRHPAVAAQPTDIAAYAGALENLSTGKLLWGRRQYETFPIASLTKVMTALVVIRSGDLDRRIKITEADEAYLGCCIAGAGLVPGDVLTGRELLYALLLPSGADAARALAIAYGPGIGGFVAKMNAEARRLHLAGTNFVSFDGVDPRDVSTAASLLTLGTAAMKLPAFRAVVKRRSFYLAAGHGHHRYFWHNRNLLLSQYRGVLGIKTGWTPQAGECLLFEAQHGTRVLIGVVLNSAPTDDGRIFIDASRLLSWGFEQHLAAAGRPAVRTRAVGQLTS
jgi:serine-type D-Ala-D-Ala carboxypeptidase (penicillin-binding protein 5/6)